MTYAELRFTQQYQFAAETGVDPFIPSGSGQPVWSTGGELIDMLIRAWQRNHVPKKLAKLAWFSGGYAASVLSFGALVNGVHFTLSMI